MTIPGVTPFAGTLPAENEPASFPARAEALFDWLVPVAAPEINAVAAGINAALNDNGTVLDTAGAAIALTTNANTIRETAGTGNAYTITPAVAVAAYADGQTFMVRPNRASTGAVTLQVGALAAVPVRKIAASGSGFVELASGDWQEGEIHIVTYRSSQFELLTVPLNSFVRVDQNQTITGDWTFAGELNGANLTATGEIVSSGTSGGLLRLVDTDDPTTHQQTYLHSTSGLFAFNTGNSSGAFVAADYVMTKGASGVTQHSLRASGAERLLVNASGIVVTGEGTFTGITSGNIVPSSDNASNLGRLDVPTRRWANIFLVNSPNVSSDARLKEDIRDLNEAERRAASKMKTRTFTMKDGGQRKIGYVAQEVIEAMASEGLDAFEYGLVTDGEIYGVDMDAINAFRLG